MTTFLRFAQSIFLLALLGALAVHADPVVATAPKNSDAEKPAIESYKTYIAAGITITYPADEQELVDEIVQGYRFPIRLLDNKSFETQLTRWKTHDLTLIAKRLALEKPSDAMNAAFEQFRGMCMPIVGEEICEIRVYHFADIKQAHAKGIKIDGVNYVPESDSVAIANHIAAERTIDTGSGAITKGSVRVIPLVLMQKVPGMTVEKMRLFNTTVRDMRWRLDEAVYNTYCGRLYEIGKNEIVSAVSNARSPLWLIDGMTNAIPLVVMRSHNPNLSFDQLLQTHGAAPSDLRTLAPRMNLDIWLMTRNAATTKAESDAYYYLALLCTLDAIQEQGEDWIPLFFKRLRAENSATMSMVEIYKIYTEITGKDLHENIARVKARLEKK